MARTNKKRNRLLDAARTLIHTQGFKQTTLADIAQSAGVPLGNVYYYFKTKEDLGAGVIAGHTAALHAHFDTWSRLATPDERLHQLVHYMEERRTVLAEYGCPIGSLCQELDKGALPTTPGAMSGELTREANGVLGLMLNWAIAQFQALNQGTSPPLAQETAEELGEHFIAQLQGIILLANARQDPQLISRQARRLHAWIDTHPCVHRNPSPRKVTAGTPPPTTMP